MLYAFVFAYYVLRNLIEQQLEKTRRLHLLCRLSVEFVLAYAQLFRKF